MCDCPNGYFQQKIIPEERDYIERISLEDAKHGINSMGMLASQNAYGEISFYCPDCERTTPVICGHGGSAWLCRKCSDNIIEKIEEER